MDYGGNGKVIKLEPGDVLVLSYLKSCEYETYASLQAGASKSTP
jgi:hypothetical protein